jgi:FkbM family methyltransferase
VLTSVIRMVKKPLRCAVLAARHWALHPGPMQPAATPLKTLRFTLGERQVDLVGRDDSSTALLLQEIFRDRVYAPVPGLPAPRVVLDIGAHQGFTSGFFRLTYPGAAILSVEPDPESFAILSGNAQRIGNCVAFNLGLFERDATAHFNAAKISVLSSLFPVNHQGVPSEGVAVRLRHAGAFADELCAQYNLPGIDLIKIDTEGAELPILHALGDRVAQAGVIQLEFHSHADRRAIDDLLCRTHTLCHGRIDRPNLGTVTYAATRLLAAA